MAIKASSMEITGRVTFIKADNSTATTQIEGAITTEASNTAKTGTTTTAITTKASNTNSRAIRAITTIMHIAINPLAISPRTPAISRQTNPEMTTPEITTTTTIKMLISGIMVMPLLDRANKIAIIIPTMAIEEATTKITALATMTGISAMTMGKIKDRESKEAAKEVTSILIMMMS